MEKYRGKFDHGWDEQRKITFNRQKEIGVVPSNAELTLRPAEIRAWNEMPEDERRLGCRLQEAQVAALSHCDYQFGQFIDELERMGILDDPLVVFVAGDNGPAGEGTLHGQVIKSASTNGYVEPVESQIKRIDTVGGPKANNNYPAGWAWAGSSPMQWLKQVASHFEGTRNGLVVSWPNGIEARDELRNQFHHCIDIVPTILELTKVRQPKSVNGVLQKPMEGVSIAYSFSDAEIPSKWRKQYFEMMGHRAIQRRLGGRCASSRTVAVAIWLCAARSF